MAKARDACAGAAVGVILFLFRAPPEGVDGRPPRSEDVGGVEKVTTLNCRRDAGPGTPSRITPALARSARPWAHSQVNVIILYACVQNIQ